MNLAKLHFYVILFFELILYPFIYLRHWGSVLQSKRSVYRARKPIETSHITVAVHEWGGYPLTRKKTIKNGETFDCGLQYQLERFSNKGNVDLIVTMSEPEKYQAMDYLQSKAEVIYVSNKGMDFSGYSAAYEKIKESPNRYIILTNSSVNSIQEEFLDDYIEFMEKNPDVGMMGVSYCTKMVQTLIRKNFTPHLQSFFLLTTTDVLTEVVTENNDKFPGVGVDHKLLLIREGEIRISQLVLKLGYRLAVVNPIDGIPYKFEPYKFWKLPFGDIRQIISTPNRITPINK